ncbi:MAG: hypothetical protein V3R82_01840 [Candidatus Hydrothermarchaeales archaeon]
MLEQYEFPKFFYLGLLAVLAFVFLEIMEGWVVAEIPDFIEVFVTFLIVVSALFMVRYLLTFVLSGID